MSGREDDDYDVSEEFTDEQMNDVDTSYEDVINIFDTGGSKGLSRYMVAKIPITKIIKEDTVNPHEERLSCSVCLIVYSDCSMAFLGCWMVGLISLPLFHSPAPTSFRPASLLLNSSFFGEQLGPLPLRETSPPASPNWKKEET